MSLPVMICNCEIDSNEKQSFFSLFRNIKTKFIGCSNCKNFFSESNMHQPQMENVMLK